MILFKFSLTERKTNGKIIRFFLYPLIMKMKNDFSKMNRKSELVEIIVFVRRKIIKQNKQTKKLTQ